MSQHTPARPANPATRPAPSGARVKAPSAGEKSNTRDRDAGDSNDDDDDDANWVTVSSSSRTKARATSSQTGAGTLKAPAWPSTSSRAAGSSNSSSSPRVSPGHSLHRASGSTPSKPSSPTSAAPASRPPAPRTAPAAPLDQRRPAGIVAPGHTATKVLARRNAGEELASLLPVAPQIPAPVAAAQGNGKRSRGAPLTIADLIDAGIRASGRKGTGASSSSPHATVATFGPALATVSVSPAAAASSSTPSSVTATNALVIPAALVSLSAAAEMQPPQARKPVGKQRQTPKRRRPTAMKKLIRKDRVLKRRLDKSAKSRASSATHSVAGAKPAVTPPSPPPRTAESDAAVEPGPSANPSSSLLNANAQPFVPAGLAELQKPAVGESPVQGSSSTPATSDKGKQRASVEDESRQDEAADDSPFDPAVYESERLSMTLKRFRLSPEALKMHTPKFREYCNQVPSDALNKAVTALLSESSRFQERLKATNPANAKQRKWFVAGLKEVQKHLARGKLRCLIVAPDIESVHLEGGLDDVISSILSEAHNQDRAVVFALSRRKIARALNIHVPVSVVGFFNYNGVHEIYRSVLELSADARRRYIEMLADAHG